MSEMQMQGEKIANPHLSPIQKKMLSLYLAARLFGYEVLSEKAALWLDTSYPNWYAESNFINPVTSQTLEQTSVYIRFFLKRMVKK